jgi:hypothetical protein
MQGQRQVFWSLKKLLEFKGLSDKEYWIIERRLKTEKKHRILMEGWRQTNETRGKHTQGDQKFSFYLIIIYIYILNKDSAPWSK